MENFTLCNEVSKSCSTSVPRRTEHIITERVFPSQGRILKELPHLPGFHSSRNVYNKYLHILTKAGL